MKKLFSFAVVTAMLAFVSTIGAVNAENSTSTVTVSENTTVEFDSTNALAGNIETSSFTLSPYLATQTDTHLWTDASDYVQINDYSTTPSHTLTVYFDDTTWAYTGTDGGGTLNVTTAATPAADAIRYEFLSSGNSFAFEKYNSNQDCTGVSGEVTLTAGAISTSAHTLYSLNATCPGKYRYSFPNATVTGPLDGVFVGSYAQSGKIMLVDA